MDDPADERLRRFSAGLAHDLNNLLNAFVGYGELLRAGLAQDAALLPYADGIVEACRRGSRLSAQLSTLGGRTTGRVRTCDLAAVAVRVLEPDGDPPLLAGAIATAPAEGDADLLAEALRLAAEHVRRCLPHGARLELATDPAGPALELHLGAVLPPGSEARLFEPFLPLGPGFRGGMALAVAQRLVGLAGGTCTVVRRPGGDALRIALQPPGSPGSRPLPATVRTVAVAVQDEVLRATIEGVLCARGMLVLAGADLAEAEAMAGQVAAGIDVLVSDREPPPGSPLAALPRLPAELAVVRTLMPA